MVLLIDCIGYPETIPKDLTQFIEVFGEIFEKKAVAFKSLAQIQQNTASQIINELKKPSASIKILSNQLDSNLYLYWLWTTHKDNKKGKALSVNNFYNMFDLVSNKVSFL